MAIRLSFLGLFCELLWSFFLRQLYRKKVGSLSRENWFFFQPFRVEYEKKIYTQKFKCVCTCVRPAKNQNCRFFLWFHNQKSYFIYFGIRMKMNWIKNITHTIVYTVKVVNRAHNECVDHRFSKKLNATATYGCTLLTNAS